MIDFNKNRGKPIKCVSSKVVTIKPTHTKKNIKRLTKDNKEFLKLIGLIKS